MKNNNLTLAATYYTYVGNKNLEGVRALLHPEVTLDGPMAKIEGKNEVLQSTSNYMKLIDSLKIQTVMQSEDQASVVYKITAKGIVEEYLAAVLLTFKDQKIIRIQLFYDPRPFLKKRDEIFQNS